MILERDLLQRHHNVLKVRPLLKLIALTGLAVHMVRK